MDCDSIVDADLKIICGGLSEINEAITGVSGVLNESTYLFWLGIICAMALVLGITRARL